MKNKINLLISIIFLSFIVPYLVFADGGMVVWPREISLNQLAQNAIVAWDGEEEIIILSNDIESDFEGTALRMVPLPSSPSEVKEGSFDSFEKITEIFNEKIREERSKHHLGFNEGDSADEGVPGVEITFHEQVGAHDLTIVKVNDLDDFIEWIEDFAEEKDLPMEERIICSEYSYNNCPSECNKITECGSDNCNRLCVGGENNIHRISNNFRKGVENYLKRGINYFVFDVINTNEGEESINPLVYRFESDYLYYPVLVSGISGIAESRAQIKVFFVTEEEIKDATYWHPYWRGNFSYSVEFDQEELEEVSEDVASLFEEGAIVTNFDYYGPLKDFDKDLIFYSDLWQRDLRIGSQGEDVKALQKIMINEGFWSSDVGATGYYGPVTANAVAKFQEINAPKILEPYGLQKGTGYFGSKTRVILRNTLSLSINKESTEDVSFSRNLYLGIQGEDVKKFQELLIKEGVWEGDVGATGYYGPITQRAAERFQEKHASEILEPLGLTRPTGFIGASTRNYLNKIK